VASPDVPRPGSSIDDDKKKKRLVGLTAREVSLVDRPANQKDFLVIKNLSEKGGIEMKREKVINEEGKEVQIVKDDPTGDVVTLELSEEEAQVALAEDLDISLDELKSLQESVKDEGEDGVGDGAGGAADTGGDAGGKEKQVKLPAATETMIKKLIALLTKLLAKYPYGYGYPKAPGSQKTTVKDGGDGSGDSESGKGASEGDGAQDVEKIGSPISRERLKTLRGVVITLQKLLDELDKKSEGEEAPAKKADEKGGEETPKEEVPVKKAEGGDGAGDKGKEDPTLLEVVAELKGRVEAMEQLEGTQKGQKADGTEGGGTKEGMWSNVLGIS